jgi:hypothetical protein
LAVTAHAYGLGVKAIVDQSINWSSDTIKVALITNAYTPNQDTDQFFSTPAASETSGSGYSAGGLTLASKTSTYNAGSHAEQLDAADVSWAASTVTAAFAVVYKSTGNNATSPVIAYVDFGGSLSTANGTFSIQWDATGILVFTLS